MEAKSCGKRLEEARNLARDPETKRSLSREQVVKLSLTAPWLQEDTRFSQQTLANWEQGNTRNITNRGRLVAVLGVLLGCGGLASVDAANAVLLQCGNGPLSPDELRKIEPWLTNEGMSTMALASPPTAPAVPPLAKPS